VSKAKKRVNAASYYYAGTMTHDRNTYLGLAPTRFFPSSKKLNNPIFEGIQTPSERITIYLDR
jgi:hypothetical protein